MSEELAFLSIANLSDLIRRRVISPVEIVEGLLKRIGLLDQYLHSYITVSAEVAISGAREAERDIRVGGYKGPLHGIPIAHKDLIKTRGVRTTAHSKVLKDYIPDEDSTVVTRLSDAGMVLLGKTNTLEFGCGTTEIFGKPHNPWDLSRYAGGSSSGSASALIAGMATATTGTDTGGSIRLPASFCGIVGLKPTFGRISRYGVIPLSWSLDTVGPMTRTVGDACLLLKAMAGPDSNDPVSLFAPAFDSSLPPNPSLKGLRVGVPQGHFYEALDPEVDRLLRTALKCLEDLGAHVEVVDLPRAADLEGVGWLLSMVEAFSHHAQIIRKRGADYGERARRRIAVGALVTAVEFRNAWRVRNLWTRELALVFTQVDVLITPTAPFPAYPMVVHETDPPDVSRNTRHFNLSGHPAISVPCGFTTSSLPVGMQIVARHFEESNLFRVGLAYEAETRWYTRRPKVIDQTNKTRGGGSD